MGSAPRTRHRQEPVELGPEQDRVGRGLLAPFETEQGRSPPPSRRSTSPTTWSAGVVAPVKNTSLNSLSPDMARMGRTSIPGWSHVHEQEREAPVLGRRASRYGRGGRSSSPPGPSTSTASGRRSPSGRRRAPPWSRREARSEPEPGSEKPWHQRSSPLRIRGRNRRFCSSVPHRSRVPPSILMLKVSL